MGKFIVSGFSDEITHDIVGQFESLNKLGINCYEPRMIGGKNVIDLDDAEVEELCTLMKKYGITASSIGSPIGKIDINDDFAPHFERFCRAVEIAKKLDCRYIRMFSFFVKEEEADSYTESVIEKLKLMVEYAEKQGVVLLHENEKGIYGNIARRCAVLFGRIKSDSFKAVFDFSNFVECSQDTLEAYEMLKEHIAYIHVKDCINGGGVVPAGCGDGNIKAILSSLSECGYEGYVSLEPHLTAYTMPGEDECGEVVMSFDDEPMRKFAFAHKSLCDILNQI